MPAAAALANNTYRETQSDLPLVKKPAQPFYLGGLAACASVSISHPLDLIKVRLQTQTGGGSSLGVIKSIYKNEGPLGFYSGLSAAVFRQLTYSTVRFGVYDTLKQHYQDENGKTPMGTTIAIGLVAGMFGGIAGNPGDVVNVRMQNDGSLPPNLRRNYKNALDGLYKIARNDGAGALFSGLGPNVGRAILITAAQLCSYDIFKQALLSTPYFKDNIGTHFSASILASLVATTLSSPFDVIKTRVMNAGAGEAKQSIVGAFSSILRNEGIGGLFKGWTPSFLRLGPQTIGTFIILEKLREFYYDSYAKRHKVRFA
ncbi:hypothetical protein H4219_000076 [Mycoemilia scoparia]|uniref:Uncharacterized protein n=1 Tax=Mycoemilia scoparia TaxID=417184 RepID=A0A9W8ACK3_9FUNG|nr:hypothetical protein H4219_000076 [Mycoemilia scoparia]